MLNELTHLPVFVDPSHGTGKRSLVAAMAKASVAAGADGLMVEVHPNPEKAFSDGPQSLLPADFAKLMQDLRPYIESAPARRAWPPNTLPHNESNLRRRRGDVDNPLPFCAATSAPAPAASR